MEVAGEQLIQDHAERIDVRLHRKWLTLEGFGCRVGRRGGIPAGRSNGVREAEARDTESVDLAGVEHISAAEVADCNVDGLAGRHTLTLGEALDIAIYRIVQECLSNALRHGEPSLITLSVVRDDVAGSILVEVADNGVGSHAAPGAGFGLTGMQERAAALGGRLGYANRPDGGFAVRAELPCTPTDTVPQIKETVR